jgi:hypothetical protein
VFNAFGQQVRIVSGTSRNQGKSGSFRRWKVVHGTSKGGAVFGLGLVLPDLEVLSGRRVGATTNEPTFDDIIQRSTWASLIIIIMIIITKAQRQV